MDKRKLEQFKKQPTTIEELDILKILNSPKVNESLIQNA